MNNSDRKGRVLEACVLIGKGNEEFFWKENISYIGVISAKKKEKKEKAVKHVG